MAHDEQGGLKKRSAPARGLVVQIVYCYTMTKTDIVNHILESQMAGKITRELLTNGKTYGFRAECQHDINELVKVLKDQEIQHVLYTQKDEDPYPDVEGVIFSTATLEELIKITRMVPDGHIMTDTIQPIALYTGERDWDR